MVNKLYESQIILYKTKAKIINIGKKEIRLLNEKNQPYYHSCGYFETDSTIFHPQGGGQPADRGTLDNIPIVHVAIEKNPDEHVFHYIDFEKYPDFDKYMLGDTIEMSIDEEFRHLCSQYHSAGHVIANLIERDPTYHVHAIKGNHFPNQAAVYFAFKNQNDPEYEILKKDESKRKLIQEKLKNNFEDIVQKALSVKILYSENQDQIKRMVDIDGYTMPCGGTHITNTTLLSNIVIGEVNCEKKPFGFKIKYSFT